MISLLLLALSLIYKFIYFSFLKIHYQNYLSKP
ncbi:hypothetical protein J801_3816, partial [Acinetobacter baumannii 45002_8]